MTTTLVPVQILSGVYGMNFQLENGDPGDRCRSTRCVCLYRYRCGLPSLIERLQALIEALIEAMHTGIPELTMKHGYLYFWALALGLATVTCVVLNIVMLR